MGIQVKKIGVNLKPSPTLLLLYSDGGKVRRREMPLRSEQNLLLRPQDLSSGTLAKILIAALWLLD